MIYGAHELVIRAPNGHPTAAEVFIHGLSGSADGVADFFPLVDFTDVILPDAKVHPVTVNHRMRMPSLFGVHGLQKSSLDKAAGILESVELYSLLPPKDEYPSKSGPPWVMMKMTSLSRRHSVC